MLNRQKSLLCLIEIAGRPVSRMELTKWAFLLAHEMPSRGGNSFYQFLPYQYGPFSFCLYHEIGLLVRNGHLAEMEINGQKAWKIVEAARRPTDNLPQPVQADVARIVERFGGKSRDVLPEYVYQRFPWFTVNSNTTRLQARPVAAPGVYTVGYEGLLIDGFLNLLIHTGVQRIVDVRNNPIARRYGFHGSTLERLSGRVQIEYVQIRELGIPSSLRQELGSQTDYEALFGYYEAETLPRQTAAVDRVASMMLEKPSTLLCMEEDPSRCHRSRLGKAVAERTGLSVHHLGAANESRF